MINKLEFDVVNLDRLPDQNSLINIMNVTYHIHEIVKICGFEYPGGVFDRHVPPKVVCFATEQSIDSLVDNHVVIAQTNIVV